jgi:hypothetical protein
LNIPDKNVADFITNLAKDHNIHYQPLQIDDLATVLAGIHGYDEKLEEVEWLIVALRRGHFISGIEMVTMHAAYLHERYPPKKKSD